MALNEWTIVDEYFSDQLVPEAEQLSWILQANADAGLQSIDITPLQAKFLSLLIRMCGAKRVLEIGTLGGYSTIWMARAIPAGGCVVSLESDPNHVEIALANLSRANVKDVVDLKLGSALDSLANLIDARCTPFDFVFVDADKANNPNYFDRVLKLTKPGSVIVFDNVVREGEVANAESDDIHVQGIRLLNERIKSCSQIDATAIQTVGTKGHDGFTIALVTG